MEQKIICTSCNRSIDGDERTYTIHGDTICEDCADGKTVVCDRCGERIWDSENEGDENITLCTSCYDNYYTSCEICDAVINTDDANYDDDDRSYCDECLKSMAEKTEGSFCYTVLSDRNELYIVKGDNPITLYKSDGFYIYASTEGILKNALRELNLSKCNKVNINCGDILKLDSNGAVEIGHFDFSDGFYRRYLLETDENYLEELAFIYGMETENILTLLEFGYDVFDIEEMLGCQEIMQEYLDYIRMR